MEFIFDVDVSYWGLGLYADFKNYTFEFMVGPFALTIYV